MDSNEVARGLVPGTDGAPGAENVREIFPGASTNMPVVNRSAGPRTARPHAAGDPGQGTRWAKASLETGMATAEYAIATLAAVGFAGLLVVILKSDEVRGFLLNIIRTALSF